jgi:hypothetical protein
MNVNNMHGKKLRLEVMDGVQRMIAGVLRCLNNRIGT